MLVEFGKFTGLHWNDTLSMDAMKHKKIPPARTRGGIF